MITGDLTERGRPEEYAALHELIRDCPLPVHLAIGNHDNRAAFLAEFSGTRFTGADTSPACFDVAYETFRLLVLDSKIEGSPAGQLGEDQLQWLKDSLSSHPETPVLIALHHPPVPVGISLLDGMRLLDADGLERVVGAHGRVVRLLAGHLHRSISAQFAGTLVAVAPSTFRQTSLTMREDRLTGYTEEPPAFLLHVARGDVWATHVIPSTSPGSLLAAF